MEREFRFGDWVYCPRIDKELFVIKHHADGAVPEWITAASINGDETEHHAVFISQILPSERQPHYTDAAIAAQVGKGLEYEREEFEAWYAAEYADMIISVKDTFGHQDNLYECPQINAAWQAWLAAKYHERRNTK